MTFQNNSENLLYKNFLDKHYILYDNDEKYAEFINKFLFDNLLNYVLNYGNHGNFPNIIQKCERCKNIEKEYEQINNLNLKRNQELYENKFKKFSEEQKRKYREQEKNLTNKYQTEIQNLNNNILKLTQEKQIEVQNLNDDILKLTQEKYELEQEIIISKNKKSVVLGVEGEMELKQIFKTMNKKVIDKHKTNHACDLWIVDDNNKIIYAIESKNKQIIIQKDIDKFNFDLKYIKENLLSGEYRKYNIIGLFISLNTKFINQEIGSLSFNKDKTYITQQYVSQNFFEIYFKTIEYLTRFRVEKNYDETLNLINDEYTKMKYLTDLCGKINQNAEEIINNSNIIYKELSVRISNFKEELVKMGIETKQKIEIENDIRTYVLKCIQEKTKINLKWVKEQSEKKNIFNGKKITSKFLIKWAQNMNV